MGNNSDRPAGMDSLDGVKNRRKHPSADRTDMGKVASVAGGRIESGAKATASRAKGVKGNFGTSKNRG